MILLIAYSGILVLLTTLAVLITIWARQAFFQPLNEALAERIVTDPFWFSSKRTQAAEAFIEGLLEQRLPWLHEQVLLEPVPPGLEYKKVDDWIGKMLLLPFLKQRAFHLSRRYRLVSARREAVIATHHLETGNLLQVEVCFVRVQDLLDKINPEFPGYDDVCQALAMVYWPYVSSLGLQHDSIFSLRWSLDLITNENDRHTMLDRLAKQGGHQSVRRLRVRASLDWRGTIEAWLVLNPEPV